ncbi:hypothetical protein IFM89_026569 [Coptis chinensis]|nr:hypothetical protein IFM89_026569 [Coptis chinensis]
MIAQYAANNLLQLNPKDSGTYVALANIYAGAGRWEDANKIRKLMNDRGLRKNPGQSWLMVYKDIEQDSSEQLINGE